MTWQLRSARMSPRKLDLLKAIKAVEDAGEKPKLRALARTLGISHITVYQHMLGLHRLNLVWHEFGEQDWLITPEGHGVLEDQDG